MSEFELQAQCSTRSPYDVLPQQDGAPSSPPPYNSEAITGLPRDGSRIGSFNSMPKAESDVHLRDSTSKLAPKSFVPAPASKRIWRHIATAAMALLMVSIPAGILTLVLYANSLVNMDDEGFTYCTTSDQYLTRNPSYLSAFNINVAFGTLSFGTAKFIDLVWDLGFSRGGQVVLGWIAYRVNTSALLRIMETQPVSYELFSTLSLSWSSLKSLGPVIEALFKKIGFRKKLLIMWIVLNILWVAIWPTMTNAMTGYIAKNQALVKLQGNGIAYANFSDVASPDTLTFTFYNYTYVPHNTSQDSRIAIGPPLFRSGPNTTLWNELYQIVLLSNEIPDSVSYNESQTLSWVTLADVNYFYQNQSYSHRYFSVPSNVQCTASGSYQWGFADNITFAFAVINGFWFIGTYAVWTHMNRKSELCRKGRSLGQYRAAVDLVESIHRDLGSDICAYSEEELRQELRKQGGIKYYVDHGEGDSPSHIGISSCRDRGPVSLRFGEPYGQLKKMRP